MSDTQDSVLLLVGSILILAITWLVIIVYWLISPFVPYRPTETQKMAFLEALGVMS